MGKYLEWIKNVLYYLCMFFVPLKKRVACFSAGICLGLAESYDFLEGEV